MEKKLDIHETWYTALRSEFEAPYFLALKAFLKHEMQHHRIFPPAKTIFKAFNASPLPAVKVVILGQDPYHGAGQAHGLAFSVPDGVKIPPSLRNIFKELASDIGFTIPQSGNLLPWAEEGVLLLNTVLTVREAAAASHSSKGWEQFTDAAIAAVSKQRSGIVFMLWGKRAISKEKLIDTNKHLILKSVHPSPLSAHRGFLGCKHFSQANNYLKKNGLLPIDWQLDNK
jgi:uracil-DNA glycosylase